MLFAGLFFLFSVIAYVKVFSNVNIHNSSWKERLTVAICASFTALATFVFYITTNHILLLCITLIICGFAFAHWKDYLKK